MKRTAFQWIVGIGGALFSIMMFLNALDTSLYQYLPSIFGALIFGACLFPAPAKEWCGKGVATFLIIILVYLNYQIYIIDEESPFNNIAQIIFSIFIIYTSFLYLKNNGLNTGSTYTEKMKIIFDNNQINITVSDNLDPKFARQFNWSDIERVCFKDAGLMDSDMLFITLSNSDDQAIIFLEAEGGTEFFGSLCDKGYFPEDVWKKALGDTSGGLHCWPKN